MRTQLTIVIEQADNGFIHCVYCNDPNAEAIQQEDNKAPRTVEGFKPVTTINLKMRWNHRTHKGRLVDVRVIQPPGQSLPVRICRRKPDSVKECGSCGSYHRACFYGDCRDDNERLVTSN